MGVAWHGMAWQGMAWHGRGSSSSSSSRRFGRTVEERGQGRGGRGGGKQIRDEDGPGDEAEIFSGWQRDRGRPHGRNGGRGGEGL